MSDHFQNDGIPDVRYTRGDSDTYTGGGSFEAPQRFGRASHKSYVKTCFFSSKYREIRPLEGNFDRGFVRWSAGGKSFRMLKLGEGYRDPTLPGHLGGHIVMKGIANFRSQFDVTILSSNYEEEPVNVFLGYKLYAPEGSEHKAAFIPRGLHRFYLEHHYHSEGWSRRAGFAFVKSGEEISLFDHAPESDPTYFIIKNNRGALSIEKQTV